ncbi:MAG: hypothetical protein JWM31_3387 [Solirubrobacterales bacterium]|nr:hypothetical protein [Solirubrobacterales bacterium]
MSTTTTTLTPADELRHRVPDGAKGRDSYFWNVILPEEELGLQVYVWIDGKGVAGRQVAVWGPGAQPLAFEAVYDIPLGADADVDDVDVAGLRIRQPEALQSAQLSFRSAAVNLEYAFEAVHPAFNYGLNEHGSPQWMAIERYEQLGRVTGHVEVAGRTIELDRLGHRDHSWGRRNWRAPQHWKWVVASTPSGRALNLFSWIVQGEVGTNGYVLRDGNPVPITGARTHARYDADGTQRSLEATITTADGERTELVMERYGVVEIPVGGGTVLWEAACRVQIDGEDGAGQFEAQWARDYVDRLVAAR